MATWSIFAAIKDFALKQSTVDCEASNYLVNWNTDYIKANTAVWVNMWPSDEREDANNIMTNNYNIARKIAALTELAHSLSVFLWPFSCA